MQSGNVSLKIDDQTILSGPYLEISEKPASAESVDENNAGGVTLNQQINISGASDTQTKNSSDTSSNTTTQKQPGPLSFVSNFAASILDGIKNIFTSIFG
jgi:hypothetical protein